MIASPRLATPADFTALGHIFLASLPLSLPDRELIASDGPYGDPSLTVLPGGFLYMRFERAIKDDRNEIWIIDDEEGQPAGYVEFVERPEDSCYELKFLFVSPERQSRGIGSKLLAHTKARIQVLGASRLKVMCFERNMGARRVYERADFIDEGEREWANEGFTGAAEKPEEVVTLYWNAKSK